MRNSRDCRTVVTDRDSIFGMKIALGQVTNEKSPKLEYVAMETRYLKMQTSRLNLVLKAF